MKTLNEIKDEVAVKYGHANFAAVKNKYRKETLHVGDLIAFVDEANRLFHGQQSLKEAKAVFEDLIKRSGMEYEFREANNDGMYGIKFWYKNQPIDHGFDVTEVDQVALFNCAFELLAIHNISRS